MNVDDNMRIPMNMNIRSIPTLKIFKDGKEVDELIGNVSKNTLIEKFDTYV